MVRKMKKVGYISTAEKRKQFVLYETKKLYKKYKGKGLISIYQYGSGFNDKDFNKNSDIDLIGIAKNKLEMKYEKKMIYDLQKYKELDIKIRILYLSELNNGKIKSFIAKVIPIKLWLIDFKNYLCLQGKKFNETDFKIKKANFDEAVNLQLQVYLDKKEQFLSNNNLSMYLIKSALYYFYYKSCKKKGYFNFSYSNLNNQVLKKYKKIVGKLIAIKNKDYDIKSTKKIVFDLDKLILN